MSRIQQAIADQYEVALDRRMNGGGEKSYTSYLYAQGLNKILKKLGEECFEVCIAAKNDDTGETVGELNDVIYHLTVLLCYSGVTLGAVMEDLKGRCRSDSSDIADFARIISSRGASGEESSYTAYLFREGLDKILKKVGEACANLLIFGKSQDQEKIAAFSGDLVYHMLAMMDCKGISMDTLADELDKRAGKTGNLKQFKRTDYTT